MDPRDAFAVVNAQFDSRLVSASVQAGWSISFIMDSADAAPRLSADPSGELATLIARELALHEEGFTVTRRIRELYGQLAQRAEASVEERHPERRAQGDR